MSHRAFNYRVEALSAEDRAYYARKGLHCHRPDCREPVAYVVSYQFIAHGRHGEHTSLQCVAHAGKYAERYGCRLPELP